MVTLNFKAVTQSIKGPSMTTVCQQICAKSVITSSPKSIDLDAKGSVPVLQTFDEACIVFRLVHSSVSQRSLHSV